MVFHSDGFLALAQHEEHPGVNHFFKISSRLPLELQMVLANRVMGLGADIVSLKHSELAFCEVGTTLSRTMDAKSSAELSRLGKYSFLTLVGLWFVRKKTRKNGT